MKRLSIALAATSLLALAGCGSRTANNSAVVDTGNDVYNVSPDDLTLNDLGNGALGNGSGNGSSSGHASSGSSSSSGNTSSGNSSASHATRNSH